MRILLDGLEAALLVCLFGEALVLFGAIVNVL